ncbi:MAG TPA: hypothetical protein VKS22_08115 [Candidatus Binataceae bacterium]|nr:hypothetical protein [Candidatus Binataceae bacterium]
MESTATRSFDEFANFYRATWIGLPSAMFRQMFGVKGEDVRAAAWRAYDSWVVLMNETTNQLYSNRVFADAVGRAFETGLMIQHIGDQLATVASSVLASAPESVAVGNDTASNLAASQSRPGGRSATTGRPRHSTAKAA